MTESDVSQLSGENLPLSAFPASNACDFRVHFDPDVHTAISSHASEDTSIEICGVVVGTWHKDDDGPFARITNFIRCDDAASKNTEVTFTHQSWSQINEEMDSKYSDKRIIGWYHSHPDFGIFLSDRDMFIQEHFFSGPGQIAYVVDPVRHLEGVFEWRNGKAELIQRYWAGDQIIPVDAAKSERPERPALTDSMSATGPTTPAQQVRQEPESPLSLTTMLLSAACLFLMGLYLGEWRSNSTQQYHAEGAIAHYGLWNVMQLGRSEQLEVVERDVSKSYDELTALSSQQAGKFEGDERTEVRKQFQAIRKTLAGTRDHLKMMQRLYSVPPEQRDLMAKVVINHLKKLTPFDARQKLPVPVPLELLNLFQLQKAEQGDTSKKTKTPSPSAKKISELPSSGTSDPDNMLRPSIIPPAASNGQ